MSEVTTTLNTSSQMYNDYDVSKIFVWNNRYEQGSLLNNSGSDKAFPVGTVLARIASTGKLVVLDKTATTTGAQYPVGVLAGAVDTISDAVEQDVYICVSGDVAQGKLVFESGTVLTDVISAKTIADRIGSDTVGIKLVTATEMTAVDNS